MLERLLTEVILVNINIPKNLTTNMISVFKFCVIWGIFLTWFADALLFDMMLKTEYRDGVDTIQDLIDRDMTLGTNKRVFQIIVIHTYSKFTFSSTASNEVAGARDESLKLRIRSNTRNKQFFCFYSSSLNNLFRKENYIT